MKHLDLFSGIGGFALAARMAGGFTTVGFCERDPWCQQVLGKNFPAIPIHDDIRTLEKPTRADVVTGGYPCQPFSLAGERRGEKDDRYLWPEMLRIIKASRPTWVIAENVAGHINLGLDQVLSDMERAGYACQAFVIPAVAVDAQHRRDRVWIIGYTDSKGKSTQPKHDEVAVMSVVANTSGGRRCQQEERQDQQPRRTKAKRSSHGAWQSWPTEPAVDRVANGIPRRVDRLRGLGNAIVPQVAVEIFKGILLSYDPTRPI